MDDLIGGLLVAVVVALLVALAIAAAVALAASSAVVGASIALASGLAGFFGVLGESLHTRGGARRAPLSPEPAFELYVLGQLRRDLRLAIAGSWTALQSFRASCARFAEKMSAGAKLPLGVGAVVGGYLGTAAAAVALALIVLPLVVLIVLFIAGAWGLVLLLRGAEAARRRIRHASYECPVDQARFALPVYICPACKAEHHRLVPGQWGIFRRECACGKTTLPTMVLNGRQRVPQCCPQGHPMSGLIGFTENVRIAIVAGPRAGKSSYLAGALLEIEQIAATGHLAICALDESRQAYDATLSALRKGTPPAQTAAGQRPALVAEVQGEGRARVLYAYDVAGESYGHSEDVRRLRFLEVPSGLVFFVDPFAIARVAEEHAESLAGASEGVRPSTEDPMRVLERMIAGLTESGARAKEVPLAVVVGKIDAFGLGAEIEKLRAGHSEAAPRAWLEAHGAGNLVRTIEGEFSTVGWFACSALGRVPDPSDRRPFTPQAAAAPLLWLLARAGVTPAARPFDSDQVAERLKSTASSDFGPISTVGWALRIVPTVLATLALIGALALAIGTSLHLESSASTSAKQAGSALARGGAAPSGSRVFHRGAYSIALPRNWRATATEVVHRGYVESRWRLRHARGGVSLLVDDTVGFGGTAESGGNSVRRLFSSRIPSYHPMAWGPIALGGRPAWRWLFDLHGKRKVDYFETGCQTGYAVLGEAPMAAYGRYSATFRRIAASLTPECG